jgi:D-alanyl-D-alanine carboxypeptidase
MNIFLNKITNKSRWPIILDWVALIAILILGYIIYSLSQSITILKNQTVYSTQIFKQEIANLQAGLATTTLTSNELSQKLADQQNKSESFQSTINDIAGTVGTLTKLSKTDKELLQKYSKVYFLSDNYVPMSLANINENYVYDKTKILQFHTSALPYLERMLNDANVSDSSISMKVVSAYRSFDTQLALKQDYLVTYGSGANKFSADQGYSEHQLGTTVDLATTALKTPLLANFASSSAYMWLSNNAYRYGFILSYPQNNTYYKYEPWHWRFVGVQLATVLHNTGNNFSDMEQRDIDTYLAYIFD